MRNLMNDIRQGRLTMVDASAFAPGRNLALTPGKVVHRNCETVNVMGYRIGGTLLSMTLALLAARGDRRFGSVTFMVSLQDFSRVGDTAVSGTSR